MATVVSSVKRWSGVRIDRKNVPLTFVDKEVRQQSRQLNSVMRVREVFFAAPLETIHFRVPLDSIDGISLC